MQRLIVVYNQNSSQYIHVRAEVLDRLKELKGFTIGKFTIEKTNFEDNVKRLSAVLKDGDFVIAAGGDATAAIAMNAIAKSDKNITLGVLPYGNFNDLAHTLGMLNFDDMLKILNQTPKTSKLYPLEIIIDDKYWRHASCYVTIGMTGESVEIFDQPKIRKNLKKGHRSSWRSYFSLAKWYFKNRHKKIFLPGLSINGVKQSPKTSDYFAVNGKSVCRIMKGNKDFLQPKVFHSTARTLTNFCKLITFMAKSILRHVPATKTTGDILEFEHPATIELQAEGEYKVFTDTKKIEVKKSSHPVTVICR